MKEEKKYIDQLFNETLNNHSFDIPEAFIEDLNKRLDAIEKKKKRGFFWWFILLVGASGFSFILALLLQQSASPVTPQSTGSIRKSTNTDKKQITELQTAALQQITELIIKENNSICVTEKPSDTDSYRYRYWVETETITETLQAPENDYTEATNKKRVTTNSKRADKKADQSFDNYHTKNNTEQSIIEEKTADEYLSTLTNNPVIVDNTTSELLKSNVQDSAINDNVLTNLSEEHLSDIVSTQAATDSSTEQMAPSTATNHSEPIFSKVKNEQTTSNWKTEIQAYGGIGTLFYFDQSDISGYSKQLQEKQSRTIVPEIGINSHFSYKNTTFGLGINYNQTGEKYTTTINEKFLKDSISYYTTYDTIYYYDSINDIWIQDTVQIQEQYTFQYEDSVLKTITVKNVYSWISVPIYFGYRFKAGAFEFIPRIGVQLNFGVAKRVGDYPDFVSQSIAPFRSKVFSLSYLVQLEIRRNFQDHWHVFVNPYFKSALTPAISTSAFSRKYSSLGIQFGVGYTF